MWRAEESWEEIIGIVLDEEGKREEWLRKLEKARGLIGGGERERRE